MELQGKFTVKHPPDAVYRFLVNAERFGKLLPDLQSLEVLTPTSFKAVFLVGISFIKGPMRVEFELLEGEEAKRASYKGKGTGMGSFIEMQAGFQLKEGGDGTEVVWHGGAQIGGRLAALAGGLLQPVAEKNAAQFIQALKREIEATA